MAQPLGAVRWGTSRSAGHETAALFPLWISQCADAARQAVVRASGPSPPKRTPDQQGFGCDLLDLSFARTDSEDCVGRAPTDSRCAKGENPDKPPKPISAFVLQCDHHAQQDNPGNRSDHSVNSANILFHLNHTPLEARLSDAETPAQNFIGQRHHQRRVWRSLVSEGPVPQIPL